MNKFLAGLLIILCSANSMAQVTSIASGAWNNTATWDCGCVPDVASAAVTIAAAHTVTVTDSRSIDQLTINGTLVINSGFTLTVANAAGTPDMSIASGGIVTNNGVLSVSNGTPFNLCAVAVDGRINNLGAINFGGTSSRMQFNANSVYDHRFTTAVGSIPQGASPTVVTWNLLSTCLISGYTTNTAVPTGLNQTFGNFTWDTPNLNAGGTLFDFNGQLNDVNGNLTINSTGAGGDVVYLGIAPPYTLNVDGNFIINSGFVGFTNDLGADATINVLGDFEVNGGLVIMSSDAANLDMDVNGDFTLTGGDIDFVFGPGVATLNLAGDVTVSSSSLTSSGGATTLNFDGTAQVFTATIAASGDISYVVFNGTTLDLGTSALTGSGDFTIQSGGKIQVGSPDGLTTGSLLGNIRVTGSRTYQANSSIVYSGITQNLGNEWGSTGALNGIAVNLELINGTVVTNNNIGITSLVGVLSLTNGRLNIGNSNTLDIKGIFNSTASGTIGGSTVGPPTETLIFSGSGAMGALNMASGAELLSNLTVGRSGTLSLGSSLTITGLIDLSFGNLDFSGRTLTMNGSGITSPGGTGLISNNTSDLVFGGSTYAGGIPFQGANQLNDLTFATPGGTFNWTSNVTINGDVTLTAGSLTHTSGLTMGTNSTFWKGAGSISGASPNAVTSYNVTYTGIGNTGVELPTLSTALNNLTVNSSGTVNLVTTGVTINGTALFSSGNFAAGANTLIMNGPTWSVSGGSFTPGTGTVEVTGNTSIIGTGTPQFYNLTVDAGANFTAKAGVMDIESNLQIDAASTFNHNNGTFNLTGAVLQVIGAGGKSLYDITVNKTGGNVQLTSALNLINSLRVISPTTFESDGNLVLVSTSDGITGNARIGQLLGGANVTGNVTAQRFMSEEGRIYRYISSPVTNASVAQLQDDFPITGTFTGASTGCTGCTTNPSMYYYDETVAGLLQDGYFQFPVADNSETLVPGRGYVPFVRDDIIAGNVTIDVTGPINQGTVVFPVTFNGSGDAAANGYNLVGNPYPSSIDWDNASGWTKTNISISIAVRDNGGGGVFHYWDGAAGTFNNGQIAMGQGFWVRATGSPTLTANEAAKTASGGIFYRTEEEEEEVHYLEMLLTNGTLTDHAYVRLRNQATNVLDEFDAPKLDNESFDMYTVSEDDLPMAINAMKTVACDQPIKLGIKDMPDGTFNLSRKAIGAFEQYTVTLHDNFTNSTVVLGTEDKYEFVIGADALSKAEDRFSITLNITVPPDVEYTDNVLHSNYTTGNQWYRNGEAIEGATEPTYTPTLSGEYSLVVTIGTCESAAARTFQITGVEEEENSGLRIYPNPAKEIVQVEVRAASDVSVDLLDVMGRSIEKVHVSERGDGVWTGSADLTHFEKGVYIVRVFDSVNGLQHRRIIKE